MDLILLTLLLLLLVLLLLLRALRSKYQNLPKTLLREYLPKGAMNLLLTDARHTTAALMRLHHKYGSIFQIWLGPVDTLVTTVPNDVAFVLSSSSFDRIDAQKSAFAAAGRKSLFLVPQLQHLKTRKSIRGNFNHSLLGDFHTDMSLAAMELCRTLEGYVGKGSGRSDEFDFYPVVASTTFRIIANTAFGARLDKEDRDVLAEASDEMLHEMLRDILGYPFLQMLSMFGTRRRLIDAKSRIEVYCHRYLKARLNESEEEREKRPVDLLDALVQFHAAEETSESLVSNILVFTVAGAHTLAGTITWSLFETCRHPDVAEKMHAEIAEVCRDMSSSEPLSMEQVQSLKYVRQVWNETLRVHAAVSMFVRTATKGLTLPGSGVHVPKGGQVVALNEASHFDKDVWDMPSQFLPERWESIQAGEKRLPAGAYVPFSVGPRNCAGQFFADHEGVLLLAELHRRFVFRLACDPEEIYVRSGVTETPKFRGDREDKVGMPISISGRGGYL